MKGVVRERKLNMHRHSGGGGGESKLNNSVQIFCVCISTSFRKFLLASELPITNTKTRAPCVIFTFLPASTVDAWRWPLGLILNWHFGGLTRYPCLGPSWVSLSKSDLKSVKLRTTLLSSAYHFLSRSHCESLLLGVVLRFHALPSQRDDQRVSYPPGSEWSTYRWRDEKGGYGISVKQHAKIGIRLSRSLMRSVYWARWMRLWHQLVELLRFRDHQKWRVGEAKVWHVINRISCPKTEPKISYRCSLSTNSVLLSATQSPPHKQSPQSATDPLSPQTESSNQQHNLLHTNRVSN